MLLKRMCCINVKNVILDHSLIIVLTRNCYNKNKPISINPGDDRILEVPGKDVKIANNLSFKGTCPKT